MLITRGVQALLRLDELMELVRKYDSFSADNDPYGENDFGSLQYAGQTMFWKFDYYDLDLQMAW